MPFVSHQMEKVPPTPWKTKTTRFYCWCCGLSWIHYDHYLQHFGLQWIHFSSSTKQVNDEILSNALLWQFFCNQFPCFFFFLIFSLCICLTTVEWLTPSFLYSSNVYWVGWVIIQKNLQAITPKYVFYHCWICPPSQIHFWTSQTIHNMSCFQTNQS